MIFWKQGWFMWACFASHFTVTVLKTGISEITRTQEGVSEKRGFKASIDSPYVRV